MYNPQNMLFRTSRLQPLDLTTVWVVFDNLIMSIAMRMDSCCDNLLPLTFCHKGGN